MRPLPPIIFMLAIMVMALLHLLLPVRQIIPMPFNFLGMILIVAGIAIASWGASTFQKVKTPIPPGEGRATRLVTQGPFRFTRNPMYLGMVSVLIGLAITFGSITPVFVIPFFVVLLKMLWVRHEERWMTEAFGDEYVEYQARVRRWL